MHPSRRHGGADAPPIARLSVRKATLDTVIIIVFLALAIAAVALTFSDTTQGNFDGGTYNSTGGYANSLKQEG